MSEIAATGQPSLKRKYRIAGIAGLGLGVVGACHSMANMMAAAPMSLDEMALYGAQFGTSMTLGIGLMGAFSRAARHSHEPDNSAVYQIKKMKRLGTIVWGASVVAGMSYASMINDVEGQHRAYEKKIATLPVLDPSTKVERTAAENYCDGRGKIIVTHKGREMVLNCGS